MTIITCTYVRDGIHEAEKIILLHCWLLGNDKLYIIHMCRHFVRQICINNLNCTYIFVIRAIAFRSPKNYIILY